MVEYEGEIWSVKSYISAVSGTVYDGAGEGLDVSGLVHVLEMEGTSIYQNQGVAIEHFTLLKIHNTLVSADTHALELAHLDNFGFTDTTTCLARTAGTSCALAACFCVQDAANRRQLDLGLCGGLQNPGVVLTAMTAGGAAGAVVGAQIGAKRLQWWSVPAGLVGGGLIGAIGGGIAAEAITDSACHSRAETRYRVNLRRIANELARCEAGISDFDCPNFFP